jgi:hypothetical protein
LAGTIENEINLDVKWEDIGKWLAFYLPNLVNDPLRKGLENM